MWTKKPYGTDIEGGGRWEITDGLVRFDIHPLYDGSGGHKETNGVILSPKKADAYAELIVKVLNENLLNPDHYAYDLYILKKKEM